MATIRRVVTVIIEIDTDNHTGKSRMQIRENGKTKREFTPSQAVTTARVLTFHADELLGLTMEPLLAVEKHTDENCNIEICKKNETE